MLEPFLWVRFVELNIEQEKGGELQKIPTFPTFLSGIVGFTAAWKVTQKLFLEYGIDRAKNVSMQRTKFAIFFFRPI